MSGWEKCHRTPFRPSDGATDGLYRMYRPTRRWIESGTDSRGRTCRHATVTVLVLIVSQCMLSPDLALPNSLSVASVPAHARSLPPPTARFRAWVAFPLHAHQPLRGERYVPQFHPPPPKAALRHT